ncbi:hypothetical protein LCGC14_2225260, partial [marine sediment metagenome]
MERLSFERNPNHPNVPDEFFCDVCHFITDPSSDEFQTWIAIHREDLMGNNTMISCRCEQKRQLAIQIRQTMLLEANIPRRDDAIGPRTFENFDDVGGAAEMVEAAKAFVTGELPEKILLLIGVTGSGRSHML